MVGRGRCPFVDAEDAAVAAATVVGEASDAVEVASAGAGSGNIDGLVGCFPWRRL